MSLCDFGSTLHRWEMQHQSCLQTLYSDQRCRLTRQAECSQCERLRLMSTENTMMSLVKLLQNLTVEHLMFWTSMASSSRTVYQHCP